MKSLAAFGLVAMTGIVMSNAVAGAATGGSFKLPASVSKTLPNGNIKALGAQSTIAVGKSTKADVMAALGKSMFVPFESGFEVWAYRFKDPSEETPQKSPSKDPPKPPPRETELVILFAPSGIATKTRTGLAGAADGN